MAGALYNRLDRPEVPTSERKKKSQLGISKLCRRVIRPTNHSVRRVCPVHVNILTIIPVLGYIVD